MIFKSIFKKCDESKSSGLLRRVRAGYVRSRKKGNIPNFYYVFNFSQPFFYYKFFVKKNLRYLPLSAACNIWTGPIYFVLMFLSTRLLSGFRIQSRQNDPWFLLPYTLFDHAFLFHLNWIQAVVSDKRCGSDSYGVHTWLHLHQAKDRCSRVQSLSRGPANFHLIFLSTVRVLEV